MQRNGWKWTISASGVFELVYMVSKLDTNSVLAKTLDRVDNWSK